MTAGQLTPDWGPNWRDDPDALDRLCQRGAEALYGHQALAAQQTRHIETITPDRRYL
ncbi:hypothetical protein [Streptomyces antimycoticus]|uniref:hypothetical protein n=1 Tax=Streptomyces TaxID=1883 RepID=UPI003403F04F